MWWFYVAEAPRYINYSIQNHINEEKEALTEIFNWKLPKYVKPNFLVMYTKDESMKDDTGETYYHLALYKQCEGFTIRWEEELKEVLKFVKKKSKLKSLRLQILNVDEVNEKMQGKA